MLPEEGSFAPRKSECYIPAEIPALLLRSGHTFYGIGPSPLPCIPATCSLHKTRRHQAAHINCSHDNRGICFDLHWRSVRKVQGTSQDIGACWYWKVGKTLRRLRCNTISSLWKDYWAPTRYERRSLIATIRSQICQ